MYSGAQGPIEILSIVFKAKELISFSFDSFIFLVSKEG